MSEEQSGFSGETASDRLYTALRAFIEKASPHQRLAPGRTLARRYQLSHSAVVNVLDRLAAEGRVYKVHGRGCFVSESIRPGPVSEEKKTVLFVSEKSAMSHIFYSRMWQGIAESAADFNFRIEVRIFDFSRTASSASPLNADWLEDLLADLSRLEVAGLIVPWLSNDMLKRIRLVRPGLPILVTETQTPGQDVAAALRDDAALGRMAARAVLADGRKRVASVFHHQAFHGGLLDQIAESGEDLTVTSFPCRRDENWREWVQPLLAAEPEVLVFSEDRICAAILQALQEVALDFLRSVMLVSHANADEEFLPREVIRIENDGYEFGRNIFFTLRGIILGDLPSDICVLLKPRMPQCRLAGTWPLFPPIPTVVSGLKKKAKVSVIT